MTQKQLGLGRVFMVPTLLSAEPWQGSLPEDVRDKICDIRHFAAENPKTARRFLKAIEHPIPIQELKIATLNKRTPRKTIHLLLEPCREGFDLGVMSEAGCPGIADPGADLAHVAHQHDIDVVPLVGPSSFLLALMASGFNGQRFSFCGYLPRDRQERKRRIHQLESESQRDDQTQIFIETPYRNQQLLDDLVKHLQWDTELAIGCDLTAPDGWLKAMPVSTWKRATPMLHKIPCIFLMYRRPAHQKLC